MKFLVYDHISLSRCIHNFISSEKEISTSYKEARLKRIEIALQGEGNYEIFTLVETITEATGNCFVMYFSEYIFLLQSRF